MRTCLLSSISTVIIIALLLPTTPTAADDFAVREAEVCAGLVSASLEQQRLAHLLVGMTPLEGEHRDETISSTMHQYKKLQDRLTSLETDSLIFLGPEFFDGRLAGEGDTVHRLMVRIDNFILTLQREDELSQERRDEAMQLIDQAMYLTIDLRDYCTQRYQAARAEIEGVEQ